MRRTLRLLLATTAVAGLAPASAAHAGPTSPTTAAVSMGDSYISGEAGRWAGNSISPAPGNDGTDRACLPAGSPVCQVDLSKVYIDGSTNGCHRSDVSELLTARLPVARRFNIACSGAVSQNLLRASTGGEGQNGEAAQGDQLGPIAKANDVKLIFVSIGGNDFGFASIVATCFTNYAAMRGPCEPEEQAKVAAASPMVAAKVAAALTDIRAVMTAAGYRNSDYRLVVQTYPSVAPRGSEGRYPGPERSAHGCPFYDSDGTWARDRAVLEIGDAVKAAARQSHAEVLDLANAFQGHEFCSKFDRQATPTDHPNAAHSEWGRIITLTQGMIQELFHPNAYGQMALGTCLTGVAAAEPGDFTCTGTAGIAPGSVSVARTGLGAVVPPITPAPPRLTVRATRLTLARGGRTCVRFSVTSSGRAVRGAPVSFAGRTARTGGSGSATLCARLAVARLLAIARRTGSTAARTSVTIRPLRLALARRKAYGRLTCASFRASTARGRAVSGALVSFAGRPLRTDRRGRVTACARLAPGLRTTTARRAGYGFATARFRVGAPRRVAIFRGRG